MWIALSIVLCALGILYCDCDRAIIRCATYIEDFLKIQITRLLMGSTPPRSQEKPDDNSKSFNIEVKEDFQEYRHELPSIELTKQIVKFGIDFREKRNPQDCRVLEWECYIRGKSYLPKFPSQPNNAAVHGSLIFVPALFCWALFLLFSFSPIHHSLPAATFDSHPVAIPCPNTTAAAITSPIPICVPNPSATSASVAPSLDEKAIVRVMSIFLCEAVAGGLLLIYFFVRLYIVVATQKLEIPQS
jgi:hypothetical protein